MEIIPAIDLKDGQVVRLVRGNPKLSKSYSYLGNPLNVAKIWMNSGAKIIHVVDLDAALGFGSNLSIIEEMIKNLNVNFQVGGGIRSLDIARKLFSIGVKRIIVGTMAFENKEALTKLLEEYSNERIIVSLDHYGREVMLKGWKVPSNFDIFDAIVNFLDLGVKIFLITSIKRDGTLTSPDFKILSKICEIKDARTIAAGGISKLEHLSMLKSLGVHGVIIGKALYENRFTLKDALQFSNN
ncbi:MAG: 1-(5-phosphoribosyl)-5-[(5-phosphoribosylamino)methylideneamino]imidazole-4-carboxamide isomerase [Nitrososphaerales archaeon]